MPLYRGAYITIPTVDIMHMKWFDGLVKEYLKDSDMTKTTSLNMQQEDMCHDGACLGDMMIN